MSLFGTINQSSGALQAAQIGLQVVGNNIANANTDGYIRQRFEQAEAVSVRDGNLIKGQGVRPLAITQVIDKQLAERLFNANTAVAGAETLADAYSQLEELTTDLNNSGLNQQFTLFNNALHDLSTQPADRSLREFVILQGETLAGNIVKVREDALDRRELWNEDFDGYANEINRLTSRIADLNLEIASLEGGGVIGSDATGLRDQRLRDVEALSEFTDLNIQEQANGAIAIFVGGDYLVSNSNNREVAAVYNEAIQGREIRIVETDAALQATSGRVAAASQARGLVFDEFIGSIDEIGSALIRGVNEVHSQGQGRSGYQQLTSTIQADSGVPLREANLAWEPSNGSFDINLVDETGELVDSHRINVRNLNQVSDSTIQSIAAEIDAIDGIAASVNRVGQLEIQSDSLATAFTFSDDTSGFLAAAGINTFFSGRSASDISINQQLKSDPDLLAISQGGIGADTEGLTALLDLVDRPLDNFGGDSIRSRYEQTVTGLGQEISLQGSALEGLRNFHATLESQHLAITGVNIDEESIKMLTYQRAFQASSRVITTANEMLDILVNL